MKKYAGLLFGILGCLLIAAIGYFWANSLMSSVFNYRSPLHDTPPAPGEPVGNPITRRVVIVLIDALRYDTSLNSLVMPFLNELRSQGASALIHSQPPSYSEPAYTTILTGAWPSINDGPTVNLDYADIPTFTQDDIFSAVHRIGLRTAISGYYWFEKLVPQQSVDDSFYTPGEDRVADQQVMDAALPWLQNGDAQLVLIHIDQVDYAGHHEGGPRDPRWNAAATRSDDFLRQIVSSVDLKQDTVLVFSDHGQINQGGHGGPELVNLLEPFVMVGAGVRPGTYADMHQVDIAPTVAALLGTNIPASAEGHVLTSMLTLSSEAETKIQTADLAQKKALYQAYVTTIGSQTKQQPNPADSSSYVTSMNDAYLHRLGRERLWRSILAFLLALLPAGILVIRKDKKLLWLVVGAVVYVLAFNFRYAILEGRTYSLSSVQSQAWLTTYVGITAAFSLVLGWLVAMLAGGAFRKGTRSAAETSLGFLFFTIYLLAIPILIHFALNGVITTWSLPEFYTSFLALLSLIQWIIVAVLGLVLTGLSAGIGWLVAKRT